MPSRESHLALAERNQRTLDYLLKECDTHSAWVATVAFYKALHLVEATFTSNPDPHKHHHNHESREAYLKRTARYKHIWSFYRQLLSASLVARYLENRNASEISSFAEYLSPDEVRGKVVGHWLKQIEASVAKMLRPKS